MWNLLFLTLILLGLITYEVHITANIAVGWHIYRQQHPKDAISTPTKIRFNKNPLVEMEGSLTKISKKEKFSIEAQGISQFQYAGKVDLIQACTDEMCVPGSQMQFNVALKTNHQYTS